MKRPLITLLTDFGSADHYVGAMKGVMLNISPKAQLIDISHAIPPYAIAEGAYTMAQAWQCFPKGTVHLVVVDPGVGSARRPIVMEAEGHCFIAPDNGVLTMIFDSVPNHKVREITASRYFRKPVSQTFHGRDIFSPVAASVASGVAPGKFGKRIHDYVRLDFANPVARGDGRWTGTVLKIDRFGNVITNFKSDMLVSAPFRITIGKRVVSHLASNYTEMASGELFVIAGSAGYLEISMNQGSAATALGVQRGAKLELQAETASGPRPKPRPASGRATTTRT